MRRKISVAVIVLIVLCLILTCVLSIYRAKHMPQKPEQGEEQTQDQTTESGTQSESEGESDVIYTEYTGEAHPGTGIVYRGSGANANTVIVIDAGHQLHAMSETEPNGPGSSEEKAKVTGGTQGSTTGLAEYELNLRVALALRDALVAKGYCVVMVRETHEVEISNAERAQLANKMGADVNIRIHANGDSNPETKGAMTVCQT
ncbi:MAG: N-acetylmuramoyl-L-alanine amidase, partial [Clostridia bacterium]|nr:N-acetylmuramoyl-L-alanine amidase [Clostridia bacterium]